jgi:uncharacterized protein
MAQAAKNQEPSMEEILASIRRIIAEDPEKPAPSEAEPAASAPETETSAPAGEPNAENSHSVPAAPQPAQDSRLPPAGGIGGAPRARRSSAILDLTESFSRPAARSSSSDVVESTDATFGDASGQEPVAGLPQSGAIAAEERGGLMSQTTSAAVDSAFNALAQTVLVQNARTLEDLVREMLRPMLKVWLDDNLPGLVERLVRAEIERVSRGRTG